MKPKKNFIFLLMIFILVGAMYFKVISARYATFNSISEAEEKIGEIKLPDLGEDYKISTIKYYNDNFTYPRTAIYFKNSKGKEIIFMTTSDYTPSFIKFESISNMTWVEKHSLGSERFGNLVFKGFKDSYMLQWRNSKQESYKYLVTQDANDKDWFIKVAEKY